MVASTPGAGPGGTDRRVAVDSRWWYWIAAVPVLGLLGFLFALFAVFLVVLDAGAGYGVSTLVVLLVVPLAGISLLVTLVAAVAFYVDAGAVAAAELAAWEPDPVLWGVIGVAGVFFPLLQIGAAVYYLYQRHRHVGTP